MTTRILLLSFYYPPDLAAGSFRMEALVQALLKESSNNVQIDVITTQPNRYIAYTAAAADSQQSPALSIRRIGVRPHKSGYLDQTRAFASYASGVCKAVRQEIRPDCCVVITLDDGIAGSVYRVSKQDPALSGYPRYFCRYPARAFSWAIGMAGSEEVQADRRFYD